MSARDAAALRPCRDLESETDTYAGIVNGKVKAGDVVVIRYEGPRGGPGMQEMLAPTSAIKGVGLDDKVALITDGRHCGTAGTLHRTPVPRPRPAGRSGCCKRATSSRSTFGRKRSVRLDAEELIGAPGTGRPPNPG